MTLLPMENRESILGALKCFEKEKPNSVPPILEDYIKQIARNGQTMIPWVYLKPLIMHKFNKVVEHFINETSSVEMLPPVCDLSDLKQRVSNALKRFDGIPFTIQRICELIEAPFRHYNRPDKYLRSLEKVCMVVTTVDPQGNKIHTEDPRLPSRAGLLECDSVTGTTASSPPNSPTIDDLHRLQTSKSSSDDDEVTDDENEDYDNQTETSSHASSTSPRESTSATQLPSLTTTPVSESWPFGRSSDSSPNKVVPKEHTVLSTLESDNHHTGSSAIGSSEVEAATTVTQGSDHQRGTINDRLAGNSPASCDRKMDSISPQADLHESPTEGSLRPIGQLEAFVQNVGMETGSVSPAPSHMEVDESLVSNANIIESTENYSTPNKQLPIESGSCTPKKRRASSPPESHAPENTCTESSIEKQDISPPDPHESPAKRRRLIESDIQTPESNILNSPTMAPNAHLNDSPPIILCNPNGQVPELSCNTIPSIAHALSANRSASPSRESPPVQEPEDPIEADPNSSGTTPAEVDPNSMTIGDGSSSAVPNLSRIDAETGEQETNMTTE